MHELGALEFGLVIGSYESSYMAWFQILPKLDRMIRFFIPIGSFTTMGGEM